MGFSCQILRGFDRAHRPEVGVVWFETRAWLRYVLLALATLTAMAMPGLLMEFMRQPHVQGTLFGDHDAHFPPGVLLVAMVALEAWCLFELWLRPLRLRSLFFRSSGVIEAPDGFAAHRGFRTVPYTLSDIVSFEVIDWAGGYHGQPVHRVGAYMRNGDLMHVAANLTYAEARKVAVQLTNAIQEFRALHWGAQCMHSTTKDVLIL